MNKNFSLINKLTRLSLFLSMGIILNIIESFIPSFIPISGVKLGLANIINIMVLYYYSLKEYILTSFLRVLTVGLLWSGLFSMTFNISLGGWFTSTFVVILLYKINKLSIFGLSLISSLFHSIGQILIVMIYYNSLQMIIYLPFLMIISILTGLIISYITSLILRKLDNSKIFNF